MFYSIDEILILYESDWSPFKGIKKDNCEIKQTPRPIENVPASQLYVVVVVTAFLYLNEVSYSFHYL